MDIDTWIKEEELHIVRHVRIIYLLLLFTSLTCFVIYDYNDELYKSLYSFISIIIFIVLASKHTKDEILVIDDELRLENLEDYEYDMSLLEDEKKKLKRLQKAKGNKE